MSHSSTERYFQHRDKLDNFSFALLNDRSLPMLLIYLHVVWVWVASWNCQTVSFRPCRMPHTHSLSDRHVCQQKNKYLQHPILGGCLKWLSHSSNDHFKFAFLIWSGAQKSNSTLQASRSTLRTHTQVDGENFQIYWAWTSGNRNERKIKSCVCCIPWVKTIQQTKTTQNVNQNLHKHTAK